jgi:prepilin-type N-terminal cleavage/methylation domain-containing protein
MKLIDTANKRRRARGFTLIELMVVMLLISIVLAVAIPKFGSGPLQDPTKKLSRWMINTVRQLRSAAIQKQTVQSLVIDLNNQRIWISDAGMGEEALSAAEDQAMTIDNSIQIRNVQYPDREQLTYGTAEIRFYPQGFSDQALIQLETDDAERLTFMIEPLLPKIKIVEEWINL